MRLGFVSAILPELTLEEVLALIREKAPRTELILTGRYAHPQVMELADYVTEMREVKHYFDKGVKAREGIEK